MTVSRFFERVRGEVSVKKFRLTQWHLVIIFVLFWGYFAFNNPAIIGLFTNRTEAGNFTQYVWLFCLIACIYFFFATKLCKLKKKWVVISIFILAAVPRIAVVHTGYYIPDNNFLEYLRFGQDFYNRDFGNIARVVSEKFQMPKMAGIAVFNGLLSYIFSPTSLGMQVANIIMTSGIAVLIYLIMDCYDKIVAVVAGTMFAMYPSNIVSTAITTNHHGATLMFMIGIFLFQNALFAPKVWQVCLLSFLSMLFLVFSNFIHPSVIVILLSLFFYCLLLFIDNWQDTRKFLCSLNVRIICYLLILFIGFNVMTFVGINMFLKNGLIKDTNEISILFKIVMGLNQDTQGAFSLKDFTYIRDLPNGQQPEACIKIIKERLEDRDAVIHLMKAKTGEAWFHKDSYLRWFYSTQRTEYQQLLKKQEVTEGIEAEYRNVDAVMTGIYSVDILFVHLVILLAIIGVLLKSKQEPADITYLMIYIILGWAAVIMLTEVQSRYRYPTMGPFIILAAVGVCEVLNRIKRIKIRGFRPQKGRFKQFMLY